MAQLTFTQIEQLWIRNGGTPGWAPLMAGIAMAESGGTSGAIEPTQPPQKTGWGLWQITPGTRKLLTPDKNAEAAVGKFRVQGLTAWQTDRIWNAWRAAHSPYQPNAVTVQKWVAEMNGGSPVPVTAAATPSWQSTIPATKTVPTARKANFPVPTTGEQFAFPGEHTYSIITPSVIPGVSATPPTSPSFGNNPVGDLATSLRFTGVFGGWAIMTIFVFIIGFAMLGLGLVMLLLVLFGPVTDAVVGTLGASRLLRSLSPGRRAGRIEQRTRLATARTTRATRNAADRTVKTIPLKTQRAPSGRRRHIASDDSFTDADRTPRLAGRRPHTKPLRTRTHRV